MNPSSKINFLLRETEQLRSKDSPSKGEKIPDSFFDEYRKAVKKAKEKIPNIKARGQKEMEWLREAALCMDIQILPKYISQELDESSEFTHRRTIQTAILLLCWIDIMLDDLAENLTDFGQAIDIFRAYEFFEEYISQRINSPSETSKQNTPKASPGLLEYFELIYKYIDLFFEEVAKLPEAKNPTKEILHNGFSNLFKSLRYSAEYRLSIENDLPLDEEKYSHENYMDKNSGNMAMSIMIGLLSTLMTEEGGEKSKVFSEKFSRVGRYGNDLATGTNEVQERQINGLACLALDREVLTSEDLSNPTAETIQTIIKANLIGALVSMWTKELDQLAATKELEEVFSPKEVREKLRRLLLLELIRMPADIKAQLQNE